MLPSPGATGGVSGICAGKFSGRIAGRLLLLPPAFSPTFINAFPVSSTFCAKALAALSAGPPTADGTLPPLG